MSKAKVTSSPLVKSKLEPALGFRTPSFFRGSKFSACPPARQGKPNFQGPKFNPSQFRTQHKGGS